MRHDEIRPGARIAFREDGPAPDGVRPGLLWLGGFMSDMTGTKAGALAELAREDGMPMLRFDYSGHGASGGAFADGTISLWLEEALQMFRAHAPGPRIVAGSSMGGWLAALLHRTLGAEASRISGLVLIAPAHDSTQALMWERFDEEAKAAILRDGVWHRPSAYGDPYPVTRGLIADGRRHLLLGRRFPVDCPVRILQGDADADVPWQHAKRVFDDLDGEDVRLTLVKGGDHRLSSPRDLMLLKETVREVAAQAPRDPRDRTDRAGDSPIPP